MKYFYVMILALLFAVAGSSSQTLQSYTAVKDTTPNNLPKGSVWFVTENFGSVWICGDSALVAKADTSNLRVWTLLNSGIPASVGIMCLEFVSTSTIYAAGFNGAIYKTTDGGNSWNVVYYNAAVTNFIDRITFFDASHGMAWGDGISSTSLQACLETTDGGATWTNNNSQLIAFANFNIVRFVPPSNVFLTGGYTPSSALMGIWKSTNAGKTWSFATIGTSSKDSVTRTLSNDFKNNLVGVACRNDSTFWSTSDGGATWQQIGFKAQTRFNYVAYVNGTNTVMAGGNKFASVAAINLDTRSITVYRDSSNNISFNYVHFPTLSRGYMSNGINRTFYSIVSSMLLPVEIDVNAIPTMFGMEQNYPNPFNPSTTILFSLPMKSIVSLKVFDIVGREVAILVSEEMSAGNHSLQWNAANVASGIYFYRLQAGTYSDTKKLVLLK